MKCSFLFNVSVNSTTRLLLSGFLRHQLINIGCNRKFIAECPLKSSTAMNKALGWGFAPHKNQQTRYKELLAGYKELSVNLGLS